MDSAKPQVRAESLVLIFSIHCKELLTQYQGDKNMSEVEYGD